ncbi:hypothetical protein YC2023_045991 [Brassica napus]
MFEFEASFLYPIPTHGRNSTTQNIIHDIDSLFIPYTVLGKFVIKLYSSVSSTPMEESHQNLPISPAPSSASLSSQPVFTFGSLPSPSPPINTSAPQTALSIPETTQKTPSSRPTPKPAINLTLSNPFSLISPPLDPPSSPTIDMPLSFSDQTSLATTIIALPAVFAPRAGSYISKEQASLSNAPTITLPLAHRVPPPSASPGSFDHGFAGIDRQTLSSIHHLLPESTCKSFLFSPLIPRRLHSITGSEAQQPSFIGPRKQILCRNTIRR